MSADQQTVASLGKRRTRSSPVSTARRQRSAPSRWRPSTASYGQRRSRSAASAGGGEVVVDEAAGAGRRSKRTPVRGGSASGSGGAEPEGPWKASASRRPRRRARRTAGASAARRRSVAARRLWPRRFGAPLLAGPLPLLGSQLAPAAQVLQVPRPLLAAAPAASRAWPCGAGPAARATARGSAGSALQISARSRSGSRRNASQLRLQLGPLLGRQRAEAGERSCSSRCRSGGSAWKARHRSPQRLRSSGVSCSQRSRRRARGRRARGRRVRRRGPARARERQGQARASEEGAAVTAAPPRAPAGRAAR